MRNKEGEKLRGWEDERRGMDWIWIWIMDIGFYIQHNILFESKGYQR